MTREEQLLNYLENCRELEETEDQIEDLQEEIDNTEILFDKAGDLHLTDVEEILGNNLRDLQIKLKILELKANDLKHKIIQFELSGLRDE